MENNYNGMRKERIIILYTFFFLLCAIVTFGFVLFRGKSLIYRDDCISDFFIKCIYRKKVFCTFFSDILHGNGVNIPFVNYNLSGDSNLTKFVGYEVFDIFFFVVPVKYFELLFCFVQILRLYLAGGFFLLYSLHHKNELKYAILGSVIYVFCGYAVEAALIQPIYLSLFYYLPLLYLGIDMITEKNDGRLFRIICALSFVTSVYLMYYASWAMVIYFFAKNIGKKWKDVFTSCLRLAKNYLLGFCISSVITVPIIIEILDSSRIINDSGTDFSLLYNPAGQVRALLSFFMFGQKLGIEFMIYGFSAVSILTIIYGGIYARNKRISIFIVLICVFMNIPLFGKLFGLSTINNRWSYCLAFGIAYGVVKFLPNVVEENSLRRRNSIVALTMLYAVASGLLFLYSKDKTYLMQCIEVLIVLITISLVWSNKILYSNATLTFCIIALLVLFISSKTKFTSSYVEMYIPAGDAISQLEEYIDCAATQIDDSTFWRMDKNTCTDELSCNLPYWFGYEGISSFNNMINPNVLRYYIITENAGIVQANKLYDLDSRFSDEILACSKYFVSTNDNNLIPYGFNAINESDKWKLYKNSNQTEIALFYDKTISQEQFSSLDVAQQQEIILTHSVKEDGEKLSGEKINKTIIPYSVEKSFGIMVDGDIHLTNNMDSEIELVAKLPLNSEIYINLDSIHSDLKKDCTFTAYIDGTEVNSGRKQGEKTDRKTNQESISLNLGTDFSDGKDHKISVVFSGGLNVSLAGINLYARSLEGIEKVLSDLNRVDILELKFATNNVVMNVQVPADGEVMFSIPYSKGWTCFVDGIKTELDVANIMYMSVPVAKGNHKIELSYFPYGMNVGVLITIFVFLLCVALRLMYKSKNTVR